MSADGYSACPACLGKRLGKPAGEVTLHELNEVARTSIEALPIRQFYEYYINEGRVIAEYSGFCEDCGYGVSFKYEHAIP